MLSGRTLLYVNKYGGNRQQEVSEISRSLKTMALELDVPVIALAQLSRSVDKREVQRFPQVKGMYFSSEELHVPFFFQAGFL